MGTQDLTRHLFILTGDSSSSARIDLQALPIIKNARPLNAVFTDREWALPALARYCAKERIPLIENAVIERADSALDILTYLNDYPDATRFAYVGFSNHDPAQEILKPKGFTFEYFALS